MYELREVGDDGTLFLLRWGDVAALEAAMVRVRVEPFPHLALPMQTLQCAFPEVQQSLVQIIDQDRIGSG
jgi:hypothetical protein